MAKFKARQQMQEPGTGGSGVILFSAVAIRREADERSEMVTQLLFGEFYRVLAARTGWIQVHCLFDSYEGWMDARLHKSATEQEYLEVWTTKPMVVPEPILEIQSNQGAHFLIPAGALLPPEAKNGEGFEYAGIRYRPVKSILTGVQEKLHPVPVARQFLQVPYLWGGKSVFGCDCSGFVQTVMRICGYRLPRDAWQQAGAGTPVDYQQAAAGDLAFFGEGEGKITHVGMIVSPQEIIHASGFVRTEILNETGIRSSGSSGYTHRLRGIRRTMG